MIKRPRVITFLILPAPKASAFCRWPLLRRVGAQHVSRRESSQDFSTLRFYQLLVILRLGLAGVACGDQRTCAQCDDGGLHHGV